MSAYAAANQPDTGAIRHVLDDPPPFHSKLLEYGERPYWSRDGRRIGRNGCEDRYYAIVSYPRRAARGHQERDARAA